MAFDFSTIFFIVIALMALQPLLMGRWYAMRRAQAIRAVEKEHGTRVITMIHRQERRSFFGFAVSRHIDLEDAQTVIAAIKETPSDTPIDLIIHTPGGRARISFDRRRLGHDLKTVALSSTRGASVIHYAPLHLVRETENPAAASYTGPGGARVPISVSGMVSM
jgi:Serine dehydrogenase proteinase